ncbi:MAG TPA: Calx-beta domain-containing protein [Pyrinomonadaceae bacterium]|nr:Calx-beta domain-containing protein [Pyrinomonadaceae bacterium]
MPRTTLPQRLFNAACVAALLFACAYHVRAATTTAAPPPVTLNLRDFGATGDGATDDGPALQRALDALASAGGGTLFVPAGRYVIATPARKDFTGLGASVTIAGVESDTPAPPPTSDGQHLTRGLDLVSEFRPKTGVGRIAVSVVGLREFLIKDVAFVGTPGVFVDALVTLAVRDVGEATVRHCEFYGLSAHADGGSIVSATRSRLRVEQSVFLGCTASSGYYSPLVQNLQWKGIHLTDTIFIDYGQRPELFSKMNFGAPYSWVNVGNAAAPTPDSPRREAVLRSVFFDEGSLNGLSSIPELYQPPSAPIDLIYVTGLRMNVTNLATTGHYLSGARGVMVERSHYGWSHNADSAIQLLNTGDAILDHIEYVAHADRIRAKASVGTLHVINSTYTHLDSLARTTKVINTATDDEDPVQHVRARYETLLSRAPDAAAHFYWTNQILRCGDDAACVATRRASLASYLAGAPTETFALTGRVTGAGGVALSGVSVALTGSQAVTATTDAEGRFSFSNLPTAGDYTLTPSKTGATFDPPSARVTTPTGNRTADFVSSQQQPTPTPTPAPPVVEFSAPVYNVLEGAGAGVFVVTRAGDTSTASSVSYSASDGSARQGHDLDTIIGRLVFAPGETSKSVSVFVTDDAHVEPNESLTLRLTNLAGAAAGARMTATLTVIENDTAAAPNPIDDPVFFVRQHYRDFFGREADAAGLAFWVAEITSCGADAACVDFKRQQVSAAFFLSTEFRETGFYVHRLYRAALGRAPRRVEEFLPDARAVGAGVTDGAPGWEQLLAARKDAFAAEFVARPAFAAALPATLTPAEFVAALDANTGDSLSSTERAAAVAEFGAAATSADLAARKRALRRVVENALFAARERSPSFVRMQYYGYLQRNPEDPPNTDLSGYDFWLAKLNEHGGDMVAAQMVRSFITSGEYRSRFGQ